MYNENDRSNYEYHYSYRPDYNEPLPTPEPSQEPKPSGHRKSTRIIAGVLAAALVLGGSFGAGWLIKDLVSSRKVNQTNLLVSERPKAEVTTVKVPSGNEVLTYPEIYSANVNSCVSINVSSTGINFFGQMVQSASSGSGFIITEDGYIVTNYHVIKGGTTVEVTLNDGTVYPAQVIGGDEDYDLAVLKVDPGETKLKPVVIGTSASLQVGDQVLAIGNPLGELTFSMSEGIVSCVDRKINVDGTPFNMVQVTAAVNSGNSGGPLFDIHGEVVGIVSAKYSTGNNAGGASVEGLGFAIPIDDVLSMIKDIMENGQVTTRPYMGISVANASAYPQAGVSSGGYLVEVVEGGPADLAGLKVGDVITMVGTTTITSRDDITSAVGSKSYSAGDTVTITFVREGKVYSTELTFGSTAEMQETSAQQTAPENMPSSPQGGTPYSGSMEDFFREFFGGNVA